jgi:hypothetical protein
MAIPPSVSTLAGTHGDYSWCLQLIGVQPLKFQDFGGGLRSAVKRWIEPVIGVASGRLAPLDIIPSSVWRRGKWR